MKNLALLLFFISFTCHAQFTVTGIVKDRKSNTPLPYATIITDEGETLAADIDGKFSTEVQKWFIVSYTGYKQQKVKATRGKSNYTILLKEHAEELKELVVERNNAANILIRKVIYKKPDNDPQKKLNSFKYKSYNRLLVTANPDSISGKLDSIYVYERIGRRFQKIDSTDFKFKKLVEKQHLYQTEKVSEFKFNKEQGLKENILATRMAGFKQPLYEIIGLTLQSYSIYQNNIELVETKYAGPLADDALSNYQYKILDTIAVEGRDTYMIYFSPKRERKKKKLEGVIYIDRENYGVAKAVLRAKSVLDVTSTHLFRYEKKLNLWFPEGKKLKINKGNSSHDITILGETIRFDAASGKDRDKEASDYVYLLSESVNFDYEYNTPVTIKHGGIAIEIKDEAINRPEEYWNKYRRDTLDSRSMETYIALDSIVAKEKLEKKIFLGKKIINGYIPIGFFDINLREVIKYNNYEGFRLGIGGITNNKLADNFRISGYNAYGTKDGIFKYNIGGSVRVHKFSSSWVGFSYTDDVKEIASTSFATDKKVFKLYDPRPINVSTFYNHETWKIHIESKAIPKTEANLQIARSRINPKFNYIFTPGDKIYPLFKLATATLALQWNPFSDFMQTPSGRIETDERFPQFTFQYMQALPGIMGSDLNFGKLDFRTEFQKKYLNGQKLEMLLQTGVAVGDTPLTHLYNTSPNNLNKNGILKRITFAGKNSFETMYFNEFYSSQYVIGQVKYGLNRFTIFRALKLEPLFVTRFAWGNMEDAQEHNGITYNTLEKGYYESGFEFNQIFKGLGFSAFYRYGPYHLPRFDRNIAIKVSFMLKLL
ncbi:hypothetical protein GCM10007424_06350 [Flavobacterium suaedae]|uniref:Carboxypeptidase-like regulatory domain-containing protein n=1 Tax=Flavobacterium suaedae TaxID=1767027 RepID=A0ABQ1JID0_9FLAO|nr:DUF5686 family protein [Flavobacterium suaedae]GGB69121.1 hypothetical protein GCM10007424_06350 [Flavobacterium suaedae]